MAFNHKEFKKATYKARGKEIEMPNLYQSIKEYGLKGRKFIARFRHENKIITKTLGYSKRDKLTPKKANELLGEYKRDIEDGYTSPDNLTLKKLFELYYKTLDKNRAGTVQKSKIYKRYIEKPLGNKKINKIKEMHIKTVMASMRERGLKPKTIKGILEVLKPLFVFAMKNKFIKESPVQFLTIKIPNQKKVVTNATKLFNQVYQGITTLYKNEPFYQSLFLFGFTGRRKTEILTLKWENIDFTNNYYWIENTKNSDNQKYELPSFIKEQLLRINDTKRGLVFKSPVTGRKISNIDRQMRNLIKHLAFMYCKDNPLYQAYTILKAKEKTKECINKLKWSDKLTSDIRNILKNYNGKKTDFIFDNLELEVFDKLSFHYMRNILVSMLAEQGIEAITLSGILGHEDVNTINKYLSINHLKSSQKGYKKIDKIIDIKVIG